MCDLSQVRKDDNKQCNGTAHHHRVIFVNVKEDIKLGSSSFSCAKKRQEATQLFIVLLVLMFCKANEDDKFSLSSSYDVVKVHLFFNVQRGLFF
jgi:hypothetical protein